MKPGSKNRTIVLTAFVAFILLSSPVQAGSVEANQETLKFSAEQTAVFAKKVEKELAKQGVRVALVARVGRDRSELPEGINFTHVGFWVYSTSTLEDGRKVKGYVTHNLYQQEKAPDTSKIVSDYPFEFFAGVKELETAIIVPTPEVQAKLLKAITGNIFKAVHNPHYSVLANLFNTPYQNCTEHVLDVLVATLYGTTDTERIKRIEQQYFTAQSVHLGPLQSLFGPLFVKGVSLSDQEGTPQVATFETIAAFMKANRLEKKEPIFIKG